MGMPVNSETFSKMVDEDIEWLKQNAPPNFIHRDSIVRCLEMAKKYYKEIQLQNMKDSEWDG